MKMKIYRRNKTHLRYKTRFTFGDSVSITVTFVVSNPSDYGYQAVYKLNGKFIAGHTSYSKTSAVRGLRLKVARELNPGLGRALERLNNKRIIFGMDYAEGQVELFDV